VTVDEQLELQRFAELGRASAYLLHELSNPLTAALLNLELSNQRSRSVRQARRNLKLLHRYVEAARRQVRLQNSNDVFRIVPQIEQLKAALLPLARGAGVKLRLGCAPDRALYGDPVKFQQIISNLISNAIDATSENKGPEVKVTWQIEASLLIIRVADSGGGIPGSMLPRLFEHFYSNKGSGMGLGLALVKLYVTRDFNGTIDIDTIAGQGSCFCLRLPLATEQLM
jgi:signal transduction histidine kinase